MVLWAYVLKFDTGFAPNPYGGICSLACCKPKIRGAAMPADWIMGTTPASVGKGRLAYLMNVDESLTFEKYFNDSRFELKKPSPTNPDGDNIYRLGQNGELKQIKNRHHGPEHITRDTSYNRVLIGKEFYYFGKNAPDIPDEYKSLIHQYVGQKKHPDSKLTLEFIKWVKKKFNPGIHGKPFLWKGP